MPLPLQHPRHCHSVTDATARICPSHMMQDRLFPFPLLHCSIRIWGIGQVSHGTRREADISSHSSGTPGGASLLRVPRARGGRGARGDDVKVLWEMLELEHGCVSPRRVLRVGVDPAIDHFVDRVDPGPDAHATVPVKHWACRGRNPDPAGVRNYGDSSQTTFRELGQTNVQGGGLGRYSRRGRRNGEQPLLQRLLPSCRPRQ